MTDVPLMMVQQAMYGLPCADSEMDCQPLHKGSDLCCFPPSKFIDKIIPPNFFRPIRSFLFFFLSFSECIRVHFKFGFIRLDFSNGNAWSAYLVVVFQESVVAFSLAIQSVQVSVVMFVNLNVNSPPKTSII